MKRATWISIVDALAFISFLLLIATGVLLKFILPPGSGRLEGGGGGRHAGEKTVSLVWDMTRHEWGEVHFWVSVVFLLVIAVHVFIHWRWILASFRGRDRTRSRLPLAIGAAALAGLIFLMLAMVFGPRQEVSRADLQQQRNAVTD